MYKNQAYSEYVAGNNGLRRYWRHRWFKIICISFIVLTLFVVTLSLILKFVILAPSKPETTTTVTSPSPTTTISPVTESTATTTTTQQSSKI